jgi:imidazolonepropionase-like amidohydrolase
LGDKLGSLNTSKIADVVIANGEPLDVRTIVKQVYINGVAIPMQRRDSGVLAALRMTGLCG